MSLARYANRRDANESSIVDALERVGVSVWRMNTPADLLCHRLGRWYVLEVKEPKARPDKRQKAQREFLDLTKTPIVRTVEQAYEALGIRHT